jgi:hypothetical protein
MSEARVGTAAGGLGSVLNHLRRPHTQQHDGDTHTLLDLGITLMLDPPREVTTDLSQRVPQLRWPTREELVRAFNQRTGLRRSKAVVEDRWIRMADYHRDLIAWVRERMRRCTGRQMAVVASAPATSGSPDAASFDLARSCIERTLAEEAFPLWAMLMTLSAADPVADESLAQSWAEDVRRWTELAQLHFEAAGRLPAPGTTTADLAEMVLAMAHGMALRYLAAPARFGHSPTRAGEMFAQASLSMLDALLLPQSPESDGLTMSLPAPRTPPPDLVAV